MPQISILLPSLRPENTQKRICEFENTAPDIDYELIVVSPFHVEGEKVVHIHEKEKRGVIAAMNEAYLHARGDIIILWSDDAMPCENSLKNMVSFIQKHKAPFAAGFRKKTEEGQESEQWQVYGKLTVGWQGLTRETIEKVGGLFRSHFRNYWADPDLSMRIWEKGGSVAVCDDAWLTIMQEEDDVKQGNLSASFDSDKEAFFSFWHDQYGKGKAKDWRRINTQVPLTLLGKIKGVLRQMPLTLEVKDLWQKWRQK